MPIGAIAVLRAVISTHEQAKALIARIEALRSADAQMDELVSQLARAIELHVKEERDLLFPKARAAKELDLMALGAQLQQRQQELMAQAAWPTSSPRRTTAHDHSPSRVDAALRSWPSVRHRTDLSASSMSSGRA